MPVVYLVNCCQFDLRVISQTTETFPNEKKFGLIENAQLNKCRFQIRNFQTNQAYSMDRLRQQDTFLVKLYHNNQKLNLNF